MPPKKGKSKGKNKPKSKGKSKPRTNQPKKQKPKIKTSPVVSIQKAITEEKQKKPKELWKVNPDKQHEFWKTQPVTQFEEKKTEKNEPIKIQTVEEIRKEPYPLPKEFEWVLTDLTNKEVLDEVYELLKGNYVEDDESTFRFDYSREFLQWALFIPNYEKDWHIGVRVVQSKKLVGFITGIPVKIKVMDKIVEMAEINFLCAHKLIRSKGLAPLLIKEVTRRINLKGVFQAFYTAGKKIPTPVASSTYFFRPINHKKLLDIGFFMAEQNMNLQRYQRIYRLPEKPQIPNLRRFESKDSASVCKLVNNFLSKFKLSIVFDEKLIEWTFLSRDQVIECWVVENKQTNEITDLFSFYTLNSSILNNNQYDTLNSCYAFYNIATTVTYVDLMKDCLVVAQNKGYDLMNSLNILDNDIFISELNFKSTGGFLHFYLYNWACPDFLPKEIGIPIL
ncbi:n-myristoyl transferase [Anaeramoeba ignava]|uniref:Glycylpeptide N-tetradecanoyltransferase n=1 Tax=Anaeramoeba ignava TaxID=1746090 RepID=A0A9Q0RCI0_ANAIG|nr:n-myristoyl transferase [Anaeramoeba ignava]